MFGVAALIIVCGFALHLSNWHRGATFDLPMSINMTGLFVLTINGMLDPPPGWLRHTLTVIAVTLIFSSELWILLR